MRIEDVPIRELIELSFVPEEDEQCGACGVIAPYVTLWRDNDGSLVAACDTAHTARCWERMDAYFDELDRENPSRLN